MDGFNFGGPARRGPQLDVRMLAFVGAAVLILAVVGVAYLQFTSRSGHAVADAQATAVGQIDRAADLQAKASAREAESAASAAYQASNGFATIGPDQLSLLDPTLTYSTAPSTSATVVSVASSQAAWAGAVLGPSGTCYWVKIAAMGVPTYGTGTTCTGAAAMAAADPHW
jgi:hypothetical protein